MKKIDKRKKYFMVLDTETCPIDRKVEGVTPENMLVYDIGVEDNHNFICENILVHNCHHIPAATMNNIAAQCKNAYYRIGVSATPWRDAGDEMLIEAVL